MARRDAQTNQRLMGEYLRGATPAAAAAAAPRAEPEEEAEGKVYLRDDVLIGEHMIGKTLVRCEVPKYDITADKIINKSIMMYGPSGSGKSHLTKYFMYKSQSAFPIVLAMSPTASETLDYDGILPDPLIHEKINNPYIAKVYQRQRAAAATFREVNTAASLDPLFRRVATDAQARNVGAIADAMNAEMATGDPGKVRAKYEPQIVNFMRVVINNSAVRLLRDPGLSPAEQRVLKYMNFNPRMMIVFDDAMTEITKCLKEKDDSIKEFFFKGRHACITHMYLFQDDVNLPPDLRKNAFISVFTAPSTALAFIGRPTNGFDKQMQEHARAVIQTVFSKANLSKYYKLLYNRMENKFYYVVAENMPQFQMCSKPVWQYTASAAATGPSIDSSNPFYARFSAPQ